MVKNQAQQGGNQAGVNVIGLSRHHATQEFAVSLIVGGLEAAQQLVERLEHLAGELRGDDVLELAAAR